MEVIKTLCFHKPQMPMGSQIIKVKGVGIITSMLIMNIKVEATQHKESLKDIEVVISNRIIQTILVPLVEMEALTAIYLAVEDQLRNLIEALIEIISVSKILTKVSY